MKKKKLESILRAGYPTLLLSEEGEVRFPNALTSEGVVSPLQIQNFEKTITYIYLCCSMDVGRITCLEEPVKINLFKEELLNTYMLCHMPLYSANSMQLTNLFSGHVRNSSHLCNLGNTVPQLGTFPLA